MIGFIADLTLLNADGFGGYLAGQLLIGIAAGLYFPAIELAVPSAAQASTPAGAMPWPEVLTPLVWHLVP